MRWTEDAEFRCLNLNIFRGVSVNAAVLCMNRLILLLPTLILMGCQSKNGEHTNQTTAKVRVNGSGPSNAIVIPVPRPNSGTYTTKEAENLLAPTLARSVAIPADAKILREWNNPTHGFSVFVFADGRIETTNVFGKSESGESGLIDAMQTSHSMQFGNPLSVLLAAELSGWNSEAQQAVLKQLFKPSIQLYLVSTEP